MAVVRNEELVSSIPSLQAFEEFLDSVPFGVGRVGSGTDERIPRDTARAKLLAAVKVLDLLRSALGGEDREDDPGLGHDGLVPLSGSLAERMDTSARAPRQDGSALDPIGQAEMWAGPVRLNPETVEVFVHDRAVHLSPAQFKVLSLLVTAGGRLVSNDAISHAVWDTDVPPARYLIKMHMRNLRRRLGEGPGEHNLIVTVWGRGYRVNVASECRGIGSGGAPDGVFPRG